MNNELRLKRAKKRFWDKVDQNGSCWLWIAHVSTEGYGIFWYEGKCRKAHRVAYLWLKGEIPEDKELDHICRVRECVNPKHLRPLTRKENILAGVGCAAQNNRKTHCKHGHEFTEENTLVCHAKRHTQRVCRKCKTRRERAIWDKKKQA